MSKREKFLSIALHLRAALDTESKHLVQQPMDAKTLQRAMEALAVYLKKDTNPPLNEGDCTAIGYCKITVEEEGSPCVAQVKFFHLNGNIPMCRDMTAESGMLLRCLPVGDYMVEISKGAEYEVITEEIVIASENPVEKVYLCKRYINLTKEGIYAGDLHHHSVYSSPLYGGTDDVIDTPETVCNSMRAMGLSFGALSDHHNIFNHNRWEKQTKQDFLPIISKEISTSNGHVLALGVAQDVIYGIPKMEQKTETYLRNEFIRITQQIKQAKGLAQLNHPKENNPSLAWNPKFDDLIPIFDTMEIWNGSHPMCAGTINAKAGELWRSLLEQNIFIPATTGSDTHNIKANDYHDVVEQLKWLRQQLCNNNIVKRIEKELDQYRDEIQAIVAIGEQVLPFLESWAETNLTSGGVRTYVLLQEEASVPLLLVALKEGRSFLTNGPILLPSIQGKSMGETVVLWEDGSDISIKLYGNHKLKRLYVHTKGGRVQEILLEEKEEAAYYDYSMTLENIQLNHTDFVFFVALYDTKYMAITNPIFLKHEK